MNNKLKNVFTDDSGQAMVEYVIVTTSTALVLFAFLNSEVLSTFPGGIYKGIYLLLRGLIINAVLPIP